MKTEINKQNKVVARIQMVVDMEIPEKLLPLDENNLENLFVIFHAGRTKIADFKIISIEDKQ